MKIEVLKGSKYIVILEKDENEKVKRVLPIKVVDFFKKEKKEEIKSEIKNFLKWETYKTISFFIHNPEIIKIFNECLSELNEEFISGLALKQ
jgi:hypothetical protein